MTKPTDRYETFHDYVIDRFPLPSIAHILEFGSGEGTNLLLDAGFQVTSVEHDPEWLGKIERSFHKYIYAPIKPFKHRYYREESGWYDVDVLDKELPNKYSLIIVDGPPRHIGRGGFDVYYEHLGIHPVPIIFDDVHRLWDHRLAGRIASKLNKEYKIFTNTSRWFGVVE
jgi:hypothetical protein